MKARRPIKPLRAHEAEAVAVRNRLRFVEEEEAAADLFDAMLAAVRKEREASEKRSGKTPDPEP